MVCTVSKAEPSWAKERSTQCCEIQRLERELQSRWALRTDSCRLARCVCPRRDQSGGVGSDLGECLRGGNCLDGYHSPLVYRRPQLDLWCRGAVIGRSLAEKMEGPRNRRPVGLRGGAACACAVETRSDLQAGCRAVVVGPHGGEGAVYNRRSVLTRTVMIFLAAPPERREIVHDTGAGSLSARPGDLGPGTDMAAKCWPCE